MGDKIADYLFCSVVVPEYICVVLLESVSGLHFLPGYKAPYAEVIPREADMASILMRPAGFSG